MLTTLHDLNHRSSRENIVLEIDPRAARPQALPGNVHIARDLGDYEALRSPSCNLLLYFWQPSAELRALLSSMPSNDLPESHLEFAAEALSAWAEEVNSEIERRLYGELLPYVEVFLKITHAKRLSRRLLRTREQMCPLFHVDNIPLRMIVTLRGTGTEWLSDSDARRKGLGKGRNDKILREGALVQQLKPFQIGFMKGQLFSDHYGKGLIHRSPEAEGQGRRRYLFKLDVVPDR